MVRKPGKTIDYLTNRYILRFEKFTDRSSSKQYNFTRYVIWSVNAIFCFHHLENYFFHSNYWSAKNISSSSIFVSFLELTYKLEGFYMFLLQFKDSNHCWGLICEKCYVVKTKITSRFLRLHNCTICIYVNS